MEKIRKCCASVARAPVFGQGDRVPGSVLICEEAALGQGSANLEIIPSNQDTSRTLGRGFGSVGRGEDGLSAYLTNLSEQTRQGVDGERGGMLGGRWQTVKSLSDLVCSEGGSFVE